MQHIHFIAKRAKFNFGPASKRDAIVYGASGAGYVHPSVRKSCALGRPSNMNFNAFLKQLKSLMILFAKNTFNPVC